MLVFLSHDVDWPHSGPGNEHILARRERFDPEIIKRVEESHFNPYYGISSLMDIEKSLGLRSTFFFRPLYDDLTSLDCYLDDLKALKDGGWEVGAHLNNSRNIDQVKSEKSRIETVIGSPVAGSRVHYLKVDHESIPSFAKAGFLYDSSVVFSKDRLDERNAGFIRFGHMIDFPITFMDAYLFSYFRLKEEQVVDFITGSVSDLQGRGARVATILWHDNVLHMHGGRMYREIVERLVSLEGIEIVRGIDAYERVTTKNSARTPS